MSLVPSAFGTSWRGTWPSRRTVDAFVAKFSRELLYHPSDRGGLGSTPIGVADQLDGEITAFFGQQEARPQERLRSLLHTDPTDEPEDGHTSGARPSASGG